MSAAVRFSALFPLPAPAEAAALPQALQLRAGEPLGVWRVVAALPACESGRWYAVEHSLAATQTAQVLVYQRTEEGMPLLLRMAEQAGMAAGLGGGLLVNALDSGVTADGLPYIVFPPQDGQPLMAASAELPLRQRLQLAVQLCEGLQTLRPDGLVLRELDPGLLWLAPGQQLRLMNLGLADLADEPVAMGPRWVGAAQGFVSPEMQGGAAPSLASESYAAGMLACWLANGRPLRRHDEHLLQSSAAVAGLNAAERLGLEALLRKAIAPQPMQRHHSVRELGEDLRAWLAGRNSSALTLTPMPMPAANDESAGSEPVRPLFVPAFDGSADEPAAPRGLRGLAARALAWLRR
jgi:serine/threonine-protein kinase